MVCVLPAVETPLLALLEGVHLKREKHLQKMTLTGTHVRTTNLKMVLPVPPS